MAGMISVTAIGNLGRDPEIRNMNNGDRVATLNLAVSESWNDRATGERKERTEWLRVTVFNPNLVSVCEKYLRKGSKIQIHNAGIQTRKWTDQSGNDKYATEIVLQRFRGELTMLDGKPESDQNNDGGHRDSGPASLDDDIPF